MKIKVYKDESGVTPKYVIEKYDEYGHHVLLSDLSEDNIISIRSQINQLIDNG